MRQWQFERLEIWRLQNGRGQLSGWALAEYISNMDGERIFPIAVFRRLTVSEERRLSAGSFSRRMFWAWPPCLRASAPSVDGFRLKHGNI